MPIETKRLKLPLPLGNESVSRAGINAIFEKIDEGIATREDVEELRQLVNEMDIPDASLIQKGKVQLSSKTNGDREDIAATEKAVGMAFQAGVERKAEVVAALNSIGVSASTSETWPQLISKTAEVIRATGTASAAQVLSGATFSNSTGNNRTGSMPNNGSGGIVTPDAENQTKLAGYYSSPITVLGDTDLAPPNIRNGINIFGVVGTFSDGVNPGDVISFAYNNNRVRGANTTPIKLYGVKLGVGGTFRVSFNLNSERDGQEVYARIYVNGKATGITRVSSSMKTATYTEDIEIKKGDELQIYTWVQSSNYYCWIGYIKLMTSILVFEESI
ncbi:hypothetical protein C161_26980 [Paenibacillus sp. FSL R5-192]|uniref:tail fiber protein n=1 Tax=Paenibacillus sp. FSL R5-192 TaxID=1226754 RepID=UPI0003E28130|nr:tail fiber protein [Paenibacillus sp. FSL R5-192]ETT31679.1 hypothetical protein C161_26980 [Paenibacillus sp. FSL R5-192]